jgi:transposase
VKAKLRLAERVFTCEQPACRQVIDRDLNAALNLARIADRHARAEGIRSYVARTGRFTKTARGGQVSPAHQSEHSPVKREASHDASQRGDALAPAP